MNIAVAGLPAGPFAAEGVALRCLPMHAGQPCGDMAAAFPTPQGLLLAMVDGLGHGPDAAHAAARAMDLLGRDPGAPLASLLATLDQGLRDTRGAAAGLARLRSPGTLDFAGVGNIAALHWRGGRPALLASVPGMLGCGIPVRAQEYAVPLEPGDWVLMHTDGVAGPLRLGPVLPEWRRDPLLLCDHLLNRHRRDRDDAAVIACIWRGGLAEPAC